MKINAVTSVVAQNNGAASFVQIFKGQAIGFADGLKLKRKKVVQDNFKLSNLSKQGN